jgi:hypothetical protein
VGDKSAHGRGGTTGRRWGAAVLIFLVGVGFLLLAVFGPVFWGADFDAGTLKTPGLGMIVAAIYVLLGVSLPALLQGKVGKDGDGKDGDDVG